MSPVGVVTKEKGLKKGQGRRVKKKGSIKRVRAIDAVHNEAYLVFNKPVHDGFADVVYERVHYTAGLTLPAAANLDNRLIGPSETMYEIVSAAVDLIKDYVRKNQVPTVDMIVRGPSGISHRAVIRLEEIQRQDMMKDSDMNSYD